jgi:hypothetical protein
MKYVALHRDIYWVGRQWAVTGFGIQACNQKQRSAFDIEASWLWEDDATEKVRAEPWLNTEDFDKALAIARKHFSESPPQAAAFEQSVPSLAETSSNEILEQQPVRGTAAPAIQKFELHVESWPAKFVRPWRIRIRR